MVKDLFDMLGALKTPTKAMKAGAFLGKKSLPWAQRHKSEEAIGKDAKPNELHGAAANAKSYIHPHLRWIAGRKVAESENIQ